MGVNNLLSIGNHALLANQVALNVTGNNVANMDVVGYSRQSVRFEEFRPMDIRPGQIGMGAYAAEVYRNFNRFVENSYLEKFTQSERWEEQSLIMQSVENIFNEANREGINSQLSAFFQSWNTLGGTPDSQASREALLAQANNLALLFRESYDSLTNIQHEMDSYIQQGVKDVNKILDDILMINKQIAVTLVPDAINPNSLYDERDRLVRQLSELIDVKVVDKGGADFSIFTKSGQTLLMEQSVFKLTLQSGTVEKFTTNFTGDLKVSGVDAYEYTLEFTSPTAFKVSLDGGKSWLRDEDGNISTFPVPDQGETVKVKNLEIGFDCNPGDTLQAGDQFYIVPKMGVYYDSPTREPINLTPEIGADGKENNLRLMGGKLSAYFTVRDYEVGRFMDKLDALANSLSWEVNMLHSQGSGLQTLTNLQGTYETKRPDLPLGSLKSGLAYGDRLTAGNLSVHFYDTATGQSVAPPLPMTSWNLDFAAVPAGDGSVTNFDPSTHSLEDVVAAINRSFVDNSSVPPRQLLTAAITGGKLSVQAADGVTFNMGADSTGLLAATGLNTFFQGSDALSISLNPMLNNNVKYINAQSVDGQTEANEGDGIIASRIAQLAEKTVRISTVWENSTQSLVEYHAGLVGLVGAETKNANFNAQYNKSLSDDLNARQQSISGVNLDEEMTNLIRFQHAYTAAAKLITTADQMLETILGLKQ